MASSFALLASGCGGGSEQTAGEAKRSYKTELLGLTFKPEQAVARPATMRIKVRNVDSKTIPAVAVTLDSFYYTEKYPELAANQRPVWVVEQGPGKPPRTPVQSQAVSPPGGGQTAYVNTWALGPLAPKHTQTFEWKVVPVKSGTHTVHITIGAGLGGRARATLANGNSATATLVAHIAPAPPSTHVDPSTGKVAAGRFSALP